MGGKIRIAIAGLGWVALHRHVPSILRHPDLELVGVIDRHKDLARQVAHKLGLSYYDETDSLKTVSWLDKIDALTIGAPPMAHASLVQEALHNGKHVLTEKPFAMSLNEGKEMAEAAQATGKTLAVVHNFQFSRAAQKLHADMENGKLGCVRRIAATQLGNPRRRLPSWYETLPFGLFYDESPHFFYLLQAISQGSLQLDRAHSVSEPGHNTPRLIHLLYHDEAGTPITIDCQFDSTISEWFVRITGEKATAIIDIFRDIYVRLPNDGAHGPFDILRTSAWAITQHIIQHIPNGLALAQGRLDYGNDEIIRRFVTAIQTGKPAEKISIAEALAVLKLQHEAIQAVQEPK